MRILLTLVLLLALAPARAAGERNPFVAPGAPAAAPRLPDIRPGPYLPAPALAPALPPPSPSAAPPAPSAAPDAGAAPAGTGGAFLSREDIEAARQRCRVSLDSSETFRAGAAGAHWRIELRVEGGPGCVKALQSSAEWLRADLEGTRLVLQAAPNAGTARSATVFIANVGTSLSLHIEQDGAPDSAD